MMSNGREQELLHEYLDEDEELLWTGSPDKKIFLTGLVAKEVPLGLALVVLTYFLTLLLTRGVVRRDIVMAFMLITVGILYFLKVLSYYFQVRQTEMKAIFGVTAKRVLSCCEYRNIRDMPLDNHLSWQLKPSSIRFFHTTKAVNWSFWGIHDPQTVSEIITKALSENEDDIW